jgi:hypothetical protein
VKEDEMGSAWGEEEYMQDFDGKPERKRPIGRPRRSWENNIKVDLREMRWRDMY